MPTCAAHAPDDFTTISFLILYISYATEVVRLERKMLPRRSPRLSQQAEKDGKRCTDTTEIQPEVRDITVISTRDVAATGAATGAANEVGQREDMRWDVQPIPGETAGI